MTDHGSTEVMAVIGGRRRHHLGARLCERSKRILTKLDLRVAIHACEVVVPPDVTLVNGLTDESSALALNTQRRQVELIHSRTPLSASADSMKKVSVDEQASLRITHLDRRLGHRSRPGGFGQPALPPGGTNSEAAVHRYARGTQASAKGPDKWMRSVHHGCGSGWPVAGPPILDLAEPSYSRPVSPSAWVA